MLFSSITSLTFTFFKQQESAFQQYIQNKNQNNDTSSSSYGETSEGSSVLEHELSHGESIEHQLALDEALARALELGDDFNHLSVNEGAVSAVGKLFTPIMLLFISHKFLCELGK